MQVLLTYCKTRTSTAWLVCGSNHRSSMPVIVYHWQGMTSYYCSVVTLHTGGTIIELQAVTKKVLRGISRAALLIHFG